MPAGTGPWGEGRYGYGSWGGGVFSGALALKDVQAVRENVLRAEFTVPVYFSTFLDPNDASIIAKWMANLVPGTGGLDGNPVRPVIVVNVVLPTPFDGIAQQDYGRFVDVILDRPMTPHPALYDLAITDIHSKDLATVVPSATFRLPAVFKKVAQPTLDLPTKSRDFANPQTREAMFDPLPNPNDPLNLAVITPDDTGDYAFDEGLTNLKKRVIRRLITRKGAFAHLPGYGVGIPQQGKKLGTQSLVADLSAQAEAQIRLEPDVSKVKVNAILDPNVPGLVRFQVLVRPREGASQRFDVPFLMSG